jgi:hypothetical protein
MTTDGKYITLQLLKQYLIGTRTDPNNPTVFNGAVQGTPDDNLLTSAIYEAESAFENTCGSAYDQQTLTMVQALTPYVDVNGWLQLTARERGPVTAVTAVQTRMIGQGLTAWQDVTLSADNVILPPYSLADTHPHPESWKVQIYPATLLPRASTGQILARWTYTGGFAVIPIGLQLLLARHAAYVYKTREAPLGKVVNAAIGTFSAPLDIPKDILREYLLWSPVYN